MMTTMRWLALPAGILLLWLAMLDLFRTLVVPRATLGRLRLTRWLFISTWRPWRWIGVRRRTQAGREHTLAMFAPLFFLIALVVWSFLAVLGFALIYWSPAFSTTPSFTTALYFSGTSLFTIGFGDVVATGGARVLAVMQGATGLGIVALVIAYLPVLYQAFSRREVGILLLDARAGSPPSGPELLRRVGGDGLGRALPGLFREWERWAADVLETHLSYPLLAYFRSPHDNTSWVTSLGAVLDAATLILAAVPQGDHSEAAEFLYATGVHTVEDLFGFFAQPERATEIGREEFDLVLRDMAAAGYPIRDPGDRCWERFRDLRGRYGGRLDALAVLVAAPPAQWIGDRSSLPAAGPLHA